MWNKSFIKFRKYGMHLMQSYWWIAVICTIIYFFTGPIAFLIGYHNTKTSVSQNNLIRQACEKWFYDWFHLDGFIVFYIVSMVLGGIIAVLMYQYLHNKRQVDFYHSQPMTRAHLFWYRYIVGLVVHLIPMMLMIGTMLVIGIANGAIEQISWTILWLHMTQIVLCTITSYSLVVFAGQLTGSIIAHYFLGLLMHFGVLVVAQCTVLIFSTFLQTYNGNFYGEKYLYYSPLTKVIGDLNQSTSVVLQSSTVIWFMVISIVISLLAFVLYQKRPCELAGNTLIYPYTDKILKLILMYVAVVLGGVVFLELAGDGFFVFGVISFGILMHMFAQVAIEKDFKAMAREIKTAVLYLCIFGLFFIGLYYDLGQFDKYIPPVDQVETVQVYFSDIDRSVYHYNEQIDTIYYDEQTKSDIIAVISEILNEKNYSSNYQLSGYEDKSSVEVIYTMQSGQVKTREYSYTQVAQYHHALARLYENPVYKKQFYSYFLALKPTSITSAVLQSNYGNQGSVSLDSGSYELNQFIEQLQLDIMDRPLSALEEGALYHMTYGYLNHSQYDFDIASGEITILPSDKRTIALLEQWREQQFIKGDSLEEYLTSSSAIYVYKMVDNKAGDNYWQYGYYDIPSMVRQQLLHLVAIYDNEIDIAHDLVGNVVTQQQLAYDRSALLTIDSRYCLVVDRQNQLDSLQDQQIENDFSEILDAKIYDPSSGVEFMYFINDRAPLHIEK